MDNDYSFDPLITSYSVSIPSDATYIRANIENQNAGGGYIRTLHWFCADAFLGGLSHCWADSRKVSQLKFSAITESQSNKNYSFEFIRSEDSSPVDKPSLEKVTVAYDNDSTGGVSLNLSSPLTPAASVRKITFYVEVDSSAVDLDATFAGIVLPDQAHPEAQALANSLGISNISPSGALPLFTFQIHVELIQQLVRSFFRLTNFDVKLILIALDDRSSFQEYTINVQLPRSNIPDDPFAQFKGPTVLQNIKPDIQSDIKIINPSSADKSLAASINSTWISHKSNEFLFDWRIYAYVTLQQPASLDLRLFGTLSTQVNPGHFFFPLPLSPDSHLPDVIFAQLLKCAFYIDYSQQRWNLSAASDADQTISTEAFHYSLHFNATKSQTLPLKTIRFDFVIANGSHAQNYTINAQIQAVISGLTSDSDSSPSNLPSSGSQMSELARMMLAMMGIMIVIMAAYVCYLKLKEGRRANYSVVDSRNQQKNDGDRRNSTTELRVGSIELAGEESELDMHNIEGNVLSQADDEGLLDLKSIKSDEQQ
jgi:hypothetical protein